MTNLPEVLSTEDRTRFAELEGIVTRGLNTFVGVGQALCVIKQGRLYREGYPTFETYCKSKFGYTRSYTARLMQAAKITQMLPIGNILVSEAMVRPLARLKDPEERKRVFVEILNTARAGGRIPVARDVEQAVDAEFEVLPKEAQEKRVRRPSVTQAEIHAPSKQARYFVNLAIIQLSRIENNDPSAREELDRVLAWIKEKISMLGGDQAPAIGAGGGRP